MSTHRRFLSLGVALATALMVLALVATPAEALTQLPSTPWGVRGKVFALLRGPGGFRIYLGGKFGALLSTTTTATAPASSLAAFSPSTGLPIAASTWPRPKVTLQGLPGTIKAMALSPDNTALYIGGQFDAVNGHPVSNLAAVSTSTGALLSTFVPPQMNQVNSILVSPTTGEVYVGGSFLNVNQQPRENLAAFFPNGTLDPNWTPSADDDVRVLKFSSDGGSIFVGGHFTTVDGQRRQSVARLNLDGTLNDWAIPAGVIVAPQTAWDMVVTSTRIFIGFGSSTNFFAAFRLDDGSTGDVVWLRHVTGNVESVALSPDGTRLFFGGHFGTAFKANSCGSFFLHGLASADPLTGVIDCTWLPHLFPDHRNFVGAWRLLIDPVNGKLWVGGFFTQICNESGTSCVKQHSVARFGL